MCLWFFFSIFGEGRGGGREGFWFECEVVSVGFSVLDYVVIVFFWKVFFKGKFFSKDLMCWV